MAISRTVSAVRRRALLVDGGATAGAAPLAGCDLLSTDPSNQSDDDDRGSKAKEAPMLAHRVEAGDLPPVEDRLFAEPNGTFLSDLATRDGLFFTQRPRHYLEKVHKNYNDDVDQVADDEGLDNWMSLFEAKGTETELLKISNGEVDFAYQEPADKPVLAQGRDEGRYRSFGAVPGYTSEVCVYLNLAHKDPVKREVLQNKGFRVGLSHAINRTNPCQYFLDDS